VNPNGLMPLSREEKKPGKKTPVFQALPEIWQLIRPRRGLLALGLVLMIINRVSGLVLPYSTKYLVDNVITKHQMSLLPYIVGGVLSATLIQGLTSFSLTQTLSKAAQKLIAELRRKVQEHIGRLSVSYYDSNKTGTMVARIMSDVEGVRNLVGTGLVDFTGGLLTAVIAFIVLMRISTVMTMIAFGFLLVFGVGLRWAFKTIRPIFKERSKINAEVTGRLTESLGGVRVVKGYHAEDREHAVFSAGVERLLQNVFKTLTATSLMSLTSSTLMGVVGAIVPWNSPLLLLCWKLAPALAAGCTMVAKPSDHSPASAVELAALMGEAGFPPGVFNVVTGFGPAVGRALAGHPDVDKVAFTGSTAVGAEVARAAAANITGVLLELGGKSAHVVFDDADLDAACNGVLAGVFAATAGEASLEALARPDPPGVARGPPPLPRLPEPHARHRRD